MSLFLVVVLQAEVASQRITKTNSDAPIEYGLK